MESNSEASPITKTFNDNDIRIATVDGEPWFVAKDVCDALEIRKHRDAISRMDEDERGSVVVDTPGGPQEMGAINEAGVYRLIFTSRKDEAEAFKRWLAHDVLPEIRKTGSYQAKPAEQKPTTQIQVIAKVAEEMVKAEEERMQAKREREEMDTRLTKMEDDKREAQKHLRALPAPEFDAPDKTPSKLVAEVVNAYVYATNADYSDAWNELYREMNYRLGINLRSRLKKRSNAENVMDVIRQDNLMRFAHSVAVKVFKHALADRFSADYFQEEYEKKAVI